LFYALLIASNVLAYVGLWAVFTGRLARNHLSGVGAVASIPAVVASCLEGITSVASAFAALGAVNAWIWWHGGGGDGTRRRLKSWASRFRGVRRTAPQGA